MHGSWSGRREYKPALNNTESVCFQKYFPPALSANLTPIRTVKKIGRTARLLLQHKGRKRCLVLVSINFTVGFRAGKLPSNYYRVFITSGSFFSPWPWWTLQKWEVLKGKSHMLALLSTDCDVHGKRSLLTSWYIPALVNMLQWGLLPRLEQEGKISSICSQAMEVWWC